MSRQRSSRVLDVDGEPVRLCGVGPGSPDVDEAVAELVRAVRVQLAAQPQRCLERPPTGLWPCLREPEHLGDHRDHRGREWS